MEDSQRNYKVASFYKFADVENPKKLVKEVRRFCESEGILGRVLISNEGINGSISGSFEQVENFEDFIQSHEKFSDLRFKETKCLEVPFNKLKVLHRNEIVAIKRDVDLNKRSEYITPDEFLSLYDENGNLREDVLLLDTRNDYEYNVGKFRGATHLNTKTFREFPEKLDQIEDKKNKKVVIYCTGGIRCEKASALLKEKGFENVKQLEGGIIGFCQEYPDTVWDGRLFVFDKRLVTSMNQNKDHPITACEYCGKASDLYKNCRNYDCDRLSVLCRECRYALNGACSEECYNVLQKKFDEKSRIKQNRSLSN
ncbi:MAG: rhodanese-related sulfurtransferase [Candidatus Pacearchaeota archaeon]